MLIAAVRRLHPGRYDVRQGMRLLGSDAAAARLEAGGDPRAIVESWQPDLAAFRRLRAPYLLYD